VQVGEHEREAVGEAVGLAPRTDAAAGDIVAATFRVLGKHVTAGEVSDVIMTLPAELVDLTRAHHAES
jgi:uncharacterized protein (DUF2267 family)